MPLTSGFILGPKMYVWVGTTKVSDVSSRHSIHVTHVAPICITELPEFTLPNQVTNKT